jgi:hypothetical protein
MGIMLAGVEYPKIDLSINVPEKLETKKINNDIISVPKIPGKKIDDEKIEINPEIPNQNNYETTIWNNLMSYYTFNNQQIDTTIIIPSPTNETISKNFNLKIKDIQEYLYQSSRDLAGRRYYYGEMVLNTIPKIDNLIPSFSDDYKKALVKFQEPYFRDKYKGYLDDFLQIMEGQKHRLGKYLYSLHKNIIALSKSNIFDDAGDNNSNLYGAIPQGYLYSIDYGRVRWEAINLDRIDPFLASFGIIKFKTDGESYAEKGFKPPINPDINSDNPNPKNDNSYFGKVLHSLRFGDKDLRRAVINYEGYFHTTKKTYLYKTPNEISSTNITENAAKDPNNLKSYYEAHFNNKINKSIYYLLSSGADFIQNMFDVAIVINNSDLEFSNFLETVGGTSISSEFTINKLFLKDTVLQVRTSSIEVPQLENETFQVKFLGQSITKVRSKIKYERKSSLKLLLDEPLYMRLFFNLLSGNSRRINDVNGKMIPNKNYSHRPPHYYAGNLSHTVSKKIDILIKHEALLNYPVIGTMKKTLRMNENLNIAGYAENNPAEYPIWWFQNVKFLGEGTELPFDRDGNSTVELSFPFIFSRCIKIDRSAKVETSNIFSKIDGENNPTETEFIKEVTSYQNNQEYLSKHNFWKDGFI